MYFALLLALRYLRASRRGGAARATAIASVAAVACGVAAYVVASALAAGFRDEMQEKILRGTAHITLTTDGGAGAIDAVTAARETTGVPGVARASRTTYTGALLIGDEATAYAVIRGIDPRDGRSAEELRRTLVAGSLAPLSDDANESCGGRDERDGGGAPSGDVPVVVGVDLADRAGLRPGSRAQVVVAGQGFGLTLPAPRVTTACVAGVFRAGLHDYDATWVYARLDRALMIDPGGAPVIAVETADAFRADRVAADIRARLGAGWTAVTWQEANRELFAALELERLVVRSIISLVTIIAALNIFTTLALTVNERQAQIATLRALGARASAIRTVFVVEGAILGAAGAGLGACLGLAACYAANRYELVRLPAAVYSIGGVQLRPAPHDVAAACAGALLVSLAAALLPARGAARLASSAAPRPDV